MAKKKAAKKKAAPKSYIAKAPIRRLMKGEGAELVANEAVQLLIDQLISVAATVTKEAVKLVKADKRKRVTAADIMDATR
ncbi:MAG: histone-like protein [Promethearchaeota archaeon]